MRASKGLVSIAVSIGLILAVTAILWRLTLTTESSRALVYIYLFPVALIAALYNGRLALLSAAIALVCADYFLQEPLYSLANDDPREYGDLFVFALLAVTAIKFVRVLVRPRALLGTNHVRRSSSGNFATFFAIRRASSLVSSLAAERRPGSSSK
jgi:K+-sensing histidine kinase KdpD